MYSPLLIDTSKNPTTSLYYFITLSLALVPFSLLCIEKLHTTGRSRRLSKPLIEHCIYVTRKMQTKNAILNH